MIPCQDCELRRLSAFRLFTQQEFQFVCSLKRGERRLGPLAEVFSEGNPSGLYTIYGGWAYRYRPVATGGHQITEVLLPGDLIGLQTLLGRDEKVRALTALTLCTLDDAFFERMAECAPGLFLSLFCLVVEKLRQADDRLVSLGKRNALQRVAHFLLDIHDRLAKLGMAGEESCPLPLQRRHFAAALGLSGTHVRRSLIELAARHLARIDRSTLYIMNRPALAELALYRPDRPPQARSVLV